MHHSAFGFLRAAARASSFLDALIEKKHIQITKFWLEVSTIHVRYCQFEGTWLGAHTPREGRRGQLESLSPSARAPYIRVYDDATQVLAASTPI